MKKRLAPTPRELQLRIAQIKSRWPSYISYTGLYQSEYGELTENRKEELRNVWNLRSMDETIVNRIESIFEKYVKQ